MNAQIRIMTRALALARKGEGLTRPNPPVGAIVMKKNRIVGEGYHRKAGREHAEVVALSKAGKRASSADLYVTLEPCSSFGKTPPCTDAIIAAGIRRVFISVRDPNPENGGKGVRLLRKAGIQVTEGICREEGECLLEPFSTWITSRRPFVTLKLGITLDGRIADSKGASRWITGPEARVRVQELRRRVDAVMVGRGTITADNPSLLPRPARGRKPVRVILDAHGRTPATAKVLSDGHADQTLIVTSAGAPKAFRQRVDKAGAEALLARRRGKQISLRDTMRRLGRKGIMHVLCEGGGEIAASLIEEKLVDEYWIFLSPKLLGGNGRPAVGGAGWPIKKAPGLDFISMEQVGKDLLIKARPE